MGEAQTLSEAELSRGFLKSGVGYSQQSPSGLLTPAAFRSNNFIFRFSHSKYGFEE